MHASARKRTKIHQVAARLSAEQFESLEGRAKAQGLTLAECLRKELSGHLEVSFEAKQMMLVMAVSAEVQRLTFVAAQGDVDVNAAEVRMRIEKQAAASAEATVERWLWLVGQSAGNAGKSNG